MRPSIRRPLIVAGLGLALALGAASGAMAGGKKRDKRDIMPAFSTGVILSIAQGKNLDPELLAAARRVAAEHGVSLRELRRLANGGNLLELDRQLPDAAVRRLAAAIAALDDRIEYAEPDVVMVPLAVSDDEHSAAQWQYQDSTGIRLGNAWALSKGRGVVVAVVDTGVRPHLDLLPNLLPGHDFVRNADNARDTNGRDPFAWDEGDWHSAGQCGTADLSAADSNWHGTHVAGTIAAVAGNRFGVAGVAPAAQVLPVRVAGRCGARTSDVIDGILWAAGLPVAGTPVNRNPAQVINLSLGTQAACGRALQRALNAVHERGVTVVAAAGNSSVNVATISPANCDGVLAVAATDRSGKRAYYSNYGSRITVAAPGGDMRSRAEDGVLSLYNAGTRRPGMDNLAYLQGTSMAAPHVAGTVALMLARQPGLSPDQVRQLIKGSARPMSALKCSGGCGGGLLDATAAVAAAATTTPAP